MLSVTVSIGVASYTGSYFARVDQLIKAADQGVYAAKAAGRNCVRIFAPRPRPIAASNASSAA
jgi:diguanylate cyclase (GGDEF)-like protein